MIGTLILLIIIGIIILFARGWRVTDLARHDTDIVTPDVHVWAVVVPDYPDKMTAYKTGLSYENTGYGVFLMPNNHNWDWVANIYPAYDQAQACIVSATDLPQNATIIEYQFGGQTLTTATENYETLQKIFSLTKDGLAHLYNLRDTADVNNLLYLKNTYHQLQAVAKELEATKMRDVLYFANQNLLAWWPVIITNIDTQNFQSIINTAISGSIFSHDNL